MNHSKLELREVIQYIYISVLIFGSFLISYIHVHKFEGGGIFTI